MVRIEIVETIVFRVDLGFADPKVSTNFGGWLL
jgi:hypothetical protein